MLLGGLSVNLNHLKREEDSDTKLEGSASTELLTVPSPLEGAHYHEKEKPSTSQQLMKMYVTDESITKAEVLWAIKSVAAHFSFKRGS